jgi:hypothetical protein
LTVDIDVSLRAPDDIVHSSRTPYPEHRRLSGAHDDLTDVKNVWFAVTSTKVEGGAKAASLHYETRELDSGSLGGFDFQD